MQSLIKIILFLIFQLFCFTSTIGYAEVNQKSLEYAKKGIVSIDTRISVAAYINVGSWRGTGFIADKQCGFIVTNAHVVGRASVGTYFVTFYNGQQSEAKLMYYDPLVDFAVLVIDPSEIPVDSEEIKFSKKQRRGTSDETGAPFFAYG